MAQCPEGWSNFPEPWLSHSGTVTHFGPEYSRYAEEIKEIYFLRNLIHIETASKKGIEFDEIEKSKLADRRMDPFIKG